jgi:hypothetical protein
LQTFMCKTITLYSLVGVALILGLAAALVWASKAARGRSSVVDPENINKPEENDSMRDPCWFVTLNDKSIPYEEIAKRENRELHGYPTDIPLPEAIKIFNEETQCNPTLKPYASLTEDELIAAIVAGPGYGAWGEVWRAQKDTLWKIVIDKRMPKGSLLTATGGPNVQESPIRPAGDIKAKGISIAIFLGLEHHAYGEALKPEQIFEIRRTFFSVETIK